MAHEDDILFDEGLTRDEQNQRKAGVDDQATYILTLIDYLEDLLSGREGMIARFGIDVKACLDIIDDMRHNLPDAIQYAQQVKDNRAEILAKAKRGAESAVSAAETRAKVILQHAQAEAEAAIDEATRNAAAIIDDATEKKAAMIDSSNVMLEARQEAETLINRARAEAQQRLEANAANIDAMYARAESDLAAAYNKIRNDREQLSYVK